MAEKIQLSQADRKKVWWRSQFLQGSWNYERMQNLGWAYSLIPAIKKLYTNKEDQAAALKRHLEFFNTLRIVRWSCYGKSSRSRNKSRRRPCSSPPLKRYLSRNVFIKTRSSRTPRTWSSLKTGICPWYFRIMPYIPI